MVERSSAVSSVRRIPLATALLVVLSACSGPWLPVATPDDAVRAQARWPTTTVEELNHGRSLVISRCGNCHQPPSPSDRRADQWPQDVADMSERSGLAPGESELLTRYLVAFARDQVAHR
jgi:hypothetical protein